MLLQVFTVDLNYNCEGALEAREPSLVKLVTGNCARSDTFRSRRQVGKCCIYYPLSVGKEKLVS